ncbi:DEAD/DEAH box helicase [Patescibacteria group bacterium]|nr:DEAD/DEAH box helicase [Patescibacteria group bacterium]MBP9710254.1 DEAD/DEAH box helicase [Patescibacteria group bacterium]
MFFLFILAIVSVWVVYSTVNGGQQTPKRPPLPTVRDAKRLALERAIRSIAGKDIAEEKMKALTIESPNVLITARAGAGKTLVIATKAALAVRTGTKPQNTLSLCFNRSAAMELGNRIAAYGAKNAPTATFHSLAFAIFRSRKNTLIFSAQQHALTRTLLTGKAEKRAKETEADPIDELVTDVLTFISSAKHKGLSVSEIWARCGGLGDLATQVASLYAAYTNHLSTHGLMDFDDLIANATVQLRALPRLPVIRLNGNACDLNALRLVSIDECQDLSPAFFHLIQALRDRNSSMGVYAVGDAWQSINSFAGSSLEYFNHFERYFPQAIRSTLLTNYRSCKAIVDNSNKWMKGLGEGGIALREGGSVENLKISCRGIGGVSVHETLKELVARERDRSVLVLARRNICHGKDLTSWQTELSRLHADVRVKTVHAAKGSEADVVLFLKEPGTGGGRLACLNGLLGIMDAEVEAEERRLEYVALTRARQRLVVVK